MTQDEFDTACETLMDALCDAGFTDASVSSTYRSEDDAVAQIDCILPDEVVRLTELLRMGTSTQALINRTMKRAIAELRKR